MPLSDHFSYNLTREAGSLERVNSSTLDRLPSYLLFTPLPQTSGELRIPCLLGDFGRFAFDVVFPVTCSTSGLEAKYIAVRAPSSGVKKNGRSDL